MANFEEMANLFAIQNVEVHKNVGLHERLLTKENCVDSFKLSDRSFVKNYRLTKDLTRYLIQLLSPFVEVKSCSSAIDLSNNFYV